MKLISNNLYVIDRNRKTVEKAQFKETQELNDYVTTVLEKASEASGDREYLFQSDSITMKTWLNQIIEQKETDNICKSIAQRLVNIEIDVQAQIQHLGKEIPKGMLIISYVDMQSKSKEKKIIIIKADYDEFIEQVTSKLKIGLATKKKIFKAFIANVASKKMNKLTTYDANTTIANYWWKDFLELEEIRSNSVNTTKAFDSIIKHIINPVKNKSKQDWLHLWNLTLGYFRLEGEFSIDDYKDNTIGRYTPYDNDINILELQAKCNDLPNKCVFDRRFEKDKNVVKGKRLKNIIKLTNEIDLIFKDSVPNLSDVLQAEENDAGEKFLKIKTVEGYEYAKNLRQSNND